MKNWRVSKQKFKSLTNKNAQLQNLRWMKKKSNINLPQAS